MADESSSNSQNQKKDQSKKGSRSGKGRSRRGRRRYFRRKKGGDGQADEKGKRDGKSGDGKAQSAEEKRRRARRNRRRRKNGKSKQSEKGPSIIEQIDNNYVPPEAVYVYTHVLRPVDTLDSYEYRPEHFSSTDRSLDDFRIDLSPLFGGDDSPDAPIQLKISQPVDFSIWDDEGEDENAAEDEADADAVPDMTGSAGADGETADEAADGDEPDENGAG